MNNNIMGDSTHTQDSIMKNLKEGYKELESQADKPTVTTYHMDGTVTVDEGTKRTDNVEVIETFTPEANKEELQAIADEITAEVTGGQG